MSAEISPATKLKSTESNILNLSLNIQNDNTNKTT